MSRPRGLLRIAELAQQAGVGRGTIQHYLREGLLPEPVKTGRNMGYYDPSCVDRIRLIQRLRATRFLPLREIRALLSPEARRTGDPAASTLLDAQRAALASLTADGHVTAMAPAEACRTLGLDPAILPPLRELRVVEARGAPGEERLEGADLEVLTAIAHLRSLGFSEEAGFVAQDLAAYRTAIEQLVHGEIATFLRVLSRARPGTDPARLARSAVHAATLLIVALRKKIIAGVLDAPGILELPGAPASTALSGRARPRAAPKKKRRRPSR